MAIAFFDFDKTLLSVNSARLWIRWQREQKRMSAWQMARGGFWITLYHLGIANVESAMRRAVKHDFAGMRQSDLQRQVQAFYQQEIQSRYRPGALAALHEQRAQGNRLVLLTSAMQELANLATQALELDDCLCTHLEVDAQGCYTGRVREPMCFGGGKLELARVFAEQHGVPLTECRFYTDSVWDLPALRRVGHPVAVNPDPRLRRKAKRHGWPIEDWGQAVPQ